MFNEFTQAPEPYILALTGAGLLIALVAWLPLALKKLPLSLPIVCIAIGAALFLSEATVKTYVSRLFTKLAARDRVQLAIRAYEGGLVRAGVADEG